jgi:hypothetical protein
MNFTMPLIAKPVSYSGEGELIIIPSSTSSAADYDFLLGSHTVKHIKLKERLNHSTEWIQINGSKKTEKILLNNGNIEKHTLNNPDGSIIEAIALRLFDQSTKLWSLYWADSINATLDFPLKGSFTDTLGIFYGLDYFNNRKIIIQFQYDKSDPDKPVWGQAFSTDLGLTWEWNWFMFFEKINNNVYEPLDS